MKQYIKGAISGFLAACILSAIPSLADTADMIFNSVRVNVGGVDKMQWGEEIELDNGTTTPSSILYNGTTYLPLRKISQILRMSVAWNGDTSTVTIRGNAGEKTELATKPDKNGNVWTYSTYTDGKYYYLEVADTARGYERVYLMASSSVRVTDNEIYFTRLPKGGVYAPYGTYMPGEAPVLIKLPFASDKNNQDGEEIVELYPMELNQAIFDGDYLFYEGSTISSMSQGVMTAFNYITGEQCQQETSTWYHYSNMTITESAEAFTKLSYMVSGTGASDCTVVFDKTTNTFRDEVSTNHWQE